MSTTVAARIDRLINDESKTKAYATLTSVSRTRIS